MRILADENITPIFAKALGYLQKLLDPPSSHSLEVIHIKDQYGTGLPDDGWIPKAPVDGIYYVITKDRRIHDNLKIRAFYKAYGLGLFIIQAPITQKNAWQEALFTLNNWEQVNTIIAQESPPFAYKISKKGFKHCS
jgi:hypothetical protein